MFKDKVYEELDDISRLIEPFQSDINEELSLFPDEIEITKEMLINSSSNWGWESIRISTIISAIAIKLNLNKINIESYSLSRDFFKIEVRDFEDGDSVTLNLETNELSHKIFIVKTNFGYEDNDLEKMAKSNIIHTIKSRLNNNRRVNKSRLNELADLYGAHEVRSDRGYRGKVNKFCKHLDALINDKKLEIKDLELCKRFGQWVVQYVSEGNLPALNNITRIKIMMHENRPIYSIEERKTT